MKIKYLYLLPAVLYALFNIRCGGVAPSVVKIAVVKESSRYEGLFRSPQGISYFNTSQDKDKLILELADNITLKTVISPDKKKAAISFYDPKNNVTCLYVIFLDDQSFKWVKRNPGENDIQVFWENDSLMYANYTIAKKKGKKTEFQPGYAELLNINQNNVVKMFKPKKGTVLKGYIQSKYLVYADRNGFYLIDKKTNNVIKTIKDFVDADVKELAFSPDGKRCLYYETKGNARSLHVTDYDGNNERIVFDYNYNPENVFWSPDSKKIACDIQSPDSVTIRYLAFFDLEDNKARFKKEESFSTISSFTNCGWSPSGNFILVKRTADNRTTYVLRDLNRERDFVIKDSVQNYTPEKIGELKQWWEDNTLVFWNETSYTIYDAIENTVAQFPTTKQYLMIQKIY